jgi:hypothetical protein
MIGGLSAASATGIKPSAWSAWGSKLTARVNKVKTRLRLKILLIILWADCAVRLLLLYELIDHNPTATHLSANREIGIFLLIGFLWQTSAR